MVSETNTIPRYDLTGLGLVLRHSLIAYKHLLEHLIIDEIIIDFHEMKIVVNKRDVAGGILAKGVTYEDNGFKKFLKNIKEDSIIIDIGASYGQYALAGAQKAIKGLVIAIEPNPAYYILLLKNIIINNITNIIPLNYAISDTQGEAILHIPNTHGEGATLFKDKLKYKAEPKYSKVINVKIKTTTIDKLLYDLNIPHSHIHIVKIDAEGAEAKILKGMKKVLNESENLVLLMEFCPFMIQASGEDPREVLELLTDNFTHIECIPGGAKIKKKNIDEMLKKITYTNLYCKR